MWLLHPSKIDLDSYQDSPCVVLFFLPKKRSYLIFVLGFYLSLIFWFWFVSDRFHTNTSLPQIDAWNIWDETRCSTSIFIMLLWYHKLIIHSSSAEEEESKKYVVHIEHHRIQVLNWFHHHKYTFTIIAKPFVHWHTICTM